MGSGGRERPLVALVEDDVSQRRLVQRWLETAGYQVAAFPDGEDFLRELPRLDASSVCLDLNLPGLSGLDTLVKLVAGRPRLPVIMLTVESAVDTVVTAMKAGAHDYLAKPLDRDRLLAAVADSVGRNRNVERRRQLGWDAGCGYQGLLGESPAFHALLERIDRVAFSNVTILLHGESGSGKELVARAVHFAGRRGAGPFVALNCAAIPETLQESELFGHEKGAFTGADSSRPGRFEEADGGTLFLDEVAELSLPLQAKLLRVLQERTFRRVGGRADLRSDFRLIAATHRDLAGEVRHGRFREDLFFRIAVFELEVPALRDRPEDVPLLAGRFLAEVAGETAPRISREVQEILQAYSWPGNVRELRNAMEHAAVLADGGVLRPEHLPARVRVLGDAPRPEGATLEDLERRTIQKMLGETGGNMSETARRLGIGRTTLYRKMKQLRAAL